jgi:lia operon protein LiaG
MTKLKKHMTLCIISILCLLVLGGCSNSKSPQMVNELEFSLKEVSNLTISYDEEKITLFEGDSDELVIKEYMSVNKSSYYAKVIQLNDSIHISEGDKPFFKSGFSRYIEVYLPASYHQNLTITTTDGDIDLSNFDLDVSMLRVDSTSGIVQLNSATASSIYLSSTSGTLKLGSIQAEEIKLETTRGNVTCSELNGDVTYISTSGNADIKAASGSGSYKANNSGKLNVVYTSVDGDLSFFNKNDNIDLTIPTDLEFNFEATTKNGSISTTFEESITINGRTTSGSVGDNPTVTIKVETNNGNIQVTQ